MSNFGATSLKKLSECHPDLQKVCRKAIEIMDFTVLCGHRGKADQDKAIEAGASKVKYPKSKHNLYPSVAVDLAPYPVNWDDLYKFYLLAGVILAVAHSLDIKLRWGGDFNMNWDLGDQKFIDLPHFEVIK